MPHYFGGNTVIKHWHGSAPRCKIGSLSLADQCKLDGCNINEPGLHFASRIQSLEMTQLCGVKQANRNALINEPLAVGSQSAQSLVRANRLAVAQKRPLTGGSSRELRVNYGGYSWIQLYSQSALWLEGIISESRLSHYDNANLPRSHNAGAQE